MGNRRRRDRGGACVAGCVAVLLGYLVFYAVGLGSADLHTAVTDAIFIPVNLVSTLLGVRAARSPRLSARVRRAWWIMTVAFACRLVAQCVWFTEEVLLGRTAYPSVADYWFLAFVGVLFAGMMSFPGMARSRREGVRLAVDALTVFGCAFMVFWYVALGPAVSGPTANFWQLAYAVALPVGDMLLVLAVATVLLRRSNPVVERPVRLIAGAIMLFVVADVGYAYVSLHVDYDGGGWPDLLWLTGCVLLAAGADSQHRTANDRRRRAVPHGAAVSWLPYGAMLLAFTMLLVEARDQPLYPLGGMLLGAVGVTLLVVLRQLTALRENRELAVTDPLTGLANRAWVTERLDALTAQPVRPGAYDAVLLVDLDRFKAINDSLGHEAGDVVLGAVAVALRTVTRGRDFAGRLGGDEFAVVLDGLPDRRAVEQIAQRLLAALRTPVIFGEHVLGIEASIGVAVRDADGVDGDELLRQADAAMYTAKRAGRGRYALWAPGQHSRDAELRRAITAGQLCLHYQPVVDLTDGRTVAVEALVRWNHPTRGLLGPGEFIGLAEESGAIVQLDSWVLRTACAEVMSWRAAVPAARDLRLNVNLSARHVGRQALVPEVATVLERTGFPADRLVLEVTETSILGTDPDIVARLDELVATGVRLAVDDFGTGYSALSYLRRFPVGIVKIDRSFILDIATDEEARTVTDAVIRLGRALRLEVVAEGVETPEQVAALRTMDCGQAQGYWFCRPVPGPELLDRLLAGALGETAAPTAAAAQQGGRVGGRTQG